MCKKFEQNIKGIAYLCFMISGPPTGSITWHRGGASEDWLWVSFSVFTRPSQMASLGFLTMWWPWASGASFLMAQSAKIRKQKLTVLLKAGTDTGVSSLSPCSVGESRHGWAQIQEACMHVPPWSEDGEFVVNFILLLETTVAVNFTFFRGANYLREDSLCSMSPLTPYFGRRNLRISFFLYLL